MNRSLLAALAVMLLLSPLPAHAQSAPSAPEAPPSFSPVDDEGQWVDDDLLAFGLDEDFLFDTVEFDGLDAGGMQVEVQVADDDAAGAPGEARVIERRIGHGGAPEGMPRTMMIRTGPGGMGGPGMGGPGMRGTMHGR
ncbi:MAG: hypothetical protein RL760_1255, partial [Candidatus Eisenbacteria bacterium]